MGILDDLIGIGARSLSGGTTGGQATPNAGAAQTALIKRLRQLGYTDQAIGSMIAGQGGGKFGGLGNDTSIPIPVPGGNFPIPLMSIDTKVGGIPSKGTALKSGSTAGNILSKIFGNSPIAAVAQGVGSRLSNPNSNASRIVNTVSSAARNAAAGRSGGAAGKPGPAYGTMNGLEFPEWNPGGAGEYPTYMPPDLVLRDFTGQANDSVNNAFAPYFASLAQMKTDTQAKGDRDRQLVGGIYDKYVSDIANQAAQTQQRYDAEGATRAQQGQDLNAQIGQNYAGANADTAKLLQSIGAQQAAPELLNQGAADQGWQQSQADQNSQAHQDYYNTQQAAQADQDKVYGQAAQNEGVRAQANVLADVAAQLQGIGYKEASQRSENAMTALDMAMKMQGQDFEAQQANAQLGQGAYQSQVGAWNARNDAVKNQYQAAMDLYNAKRQQIQDQLGQKRWEAEFNQRGQFQQGDWLLKQLDAQSQGGVKPIDPTGLNSVSQQIAQGTGNVNVADDISNAAYEVTTSSNTPVNDQNAYFAFMQRAQAIAEANGLTRAEVIPYMQQYWTEYAKGKIANQ